MNIDVLYIHLKDGLFGKRYLAYKQTAELNELARKHDTRGFFHSTVGSFKVLCKVCQQHIHEGKVAPVVGGYNLLVSCKCTKGVQKKLSVTEHEVRSNSALAAAYLKAIWAGKKTYR
jgi:hypothetical protein